MMASKLSNLVSADEINVLLTKKGFQNIRINVHPHGAASQNFRVLVGSNDHDITVRCDFRRSHSQIAIDNVFSELAFRNGIHVPRAQRNLGQIGNAAVTMRNTLLGETVADVGKEELPSPAKIGALLRLINKITCHLPERPPFYGALLDRQNVLWDEIESTPHLAEEGEPTSLAVCEALRRINQSAYSIERLKKSPVGMIHGDFNPPNLLLHASKVAVLDWEKACCWYIAADITQAIYYFSPGYHVAGIDFAMDFLKGYDVDSLLEPGVLEAWLTVFPALIFLRDVVSAQRTYQGNAGPARKRRASQYFKQDSLPRFLHFLNHPPSIS